MKEKIFKKIRSIKKSIKNHIMLKKEIYTLATFLMFVLSFFISCAVLYNYTVYKDNVQFYKNHEQIEYDKLIKDLKSGNFVSYSKNIVYPEYLKFSNIWYDTKKAPTVDVYLFSHKDGPKYLYVEDSLKSGSLNLNKEDKDLAKAMFSLRTVQSEVINFFPFSFKSIFDSLIWIFGLVFIIFAAQFLMGELVAGKNFSQKKLDTDIEFDDIIGYDDVKEQFLEIASYIKNKKHFDKNSISVPKGILLTGEPGVGKTLFAKAFANNVNATLFFASGADFAEMYVGVGAKRVRSLFRSASLASPAVIFIDEFDAIGSRSNMTQDSERISVINQLLTEMDGLNKKADIFVIATTNYEDKIDAALMRPGRIDKTINIPLPDKTTRYKIMQYYLKDFTADHETLEKLSIRMQSMSAATIKNIVEQAKSLVVKKHASKENYKRHINEEDFTEAFDNTFLGRKNDFDYNVSTKNRIAYHELGHAFVSQVLNPSFKIEKITIEPRGKGLGSTIFTPKEEMFLHTQEQLISSICSLLGGRAAEELFLHSISSGASDDLKRANTIAHEMINTFGMGKSTQLLVDIFPQNPYKLELQTKQRQEILNDCYVKSMSVLKFYKNEIEEVFNQLIEEKTINGIIVSDIVDKKPYELTLSDFNEDVELLNNK